nr:hypothetical protein GCM10020063_092180 [Dactylosporangium thailandense]
MRVLHFLSALSGGPTPAAVLVACGAAGGSLKLFHAIIGK